MKINERNVMQLFILFFISVLFGAGCTDAGFEKLTAFGSGHSVKCYSGGTVIYDGVASGKVMSEKNSDGYYFKDEQTGQLMEVSGNCVIKRID